MTDRELLGAAARAAGLHVVGAQSADLLVYSDGCHGGVRWNPLADDGDALRLAVKLGINITLTEMDYGRPVTQTMNGYTVETYEERHGADPYAATRRAIVRAAAAMADQERPKA